MKLAALQLLAVVAWGQSLTVSLPARGTPGQVLSGSVTFDAAIDVAGLQWTLPAGAVVAGAQPVIPNKSAICASSRICLVIGVTPAPIAGVIAPGSVFNSLPIGPGPLQAFSFTIPATAQLGSVIPVQLSAVFGASPSGSAVTVASVPASVQVANATLADAQSSVSQWLGAATFANFQLIYKLWPKLP